ncbi:hypothetical protein FZ934_09115 [Rhizobium grahamii]|uniref:EF-hand domain-containing protein n=1 Tax=Rhizobium grahamii TaxID=1120045 RepID=A0A5Q0C501_9HYPH|nr:MULTISPECIES: hypothetical protein [Rhizobium]QFY60572.1 hypothetical protein FZ934_09115 [Rhizobium grahamii]QRM50297.1 hypothetical protein F3Y33_13775 [Rhizobium sp. BG6]
MTSVSSIGSGVSQYSSLSSLDKNGDGIISADELAAANASSKSTSSTKAPTSTSTDDVASVTHKIAGDILSIMLQMQQSSASDDDSSSSDDDSKGILASLDANGDGKLTTDEFLSADTSSIASSAAGSDDPILSEVLDDMQTALRAYQNTYGTSAAADSGSSDVQTA